MSKNTFSPSMTLAGMDYIAPSAACIKPTMMRTQQENNEVSYTVGRHAHNETDSTNHFSMLLHGAKQLPARPQIIKITLQDCLACSGCVTTAQTILVNAQSREELLRTRAEQWNQANKIALALESQQVASGNCVTHSTHSTRVGKTNKTEDDMQMFVDQSDMPPWLITISEQSASSTAAYLSCSVCQAYKIIAGFMYYVLTHHVHEGITQHDLESEVKTNVTSDITHSGNSLDACTQVGNVDKNDTNKVMQNKQANTDRCDIVNDPATMHTKVDESHCQRKNGHGKIYVSDLRWASRLSSQKTSEQYERRVNHPQAQYPLPLLVSACPGWVCYCEKQGAALLPHLCPVLSPQGLAGSLAKRLLGPNLYHVSVQPCFDRKLQAARDHVQRSDLIHDYNKSKKYKVDVNRTTLHTSLSAQQWQVQQQQQFQKQSKLQQKQLTLQNVNQNCYGGDKSNFLSFHQNNNHESSTDNTQKLMCQTTNMESGLLTKVNNIDNDCKTQEDDHDVFYTDCVISTLQLLQWMREVDPTFPWRRQLNSIDDVEEESQYTSLSRSAFASSQQQEQSANQHQQQQQLSLRRQLQQQQKQKKMSYNRNMNINNDISNIHNLDNSSDINVTADQHQCNWTRVLQDTIDNSKGVISKNSSKNMCNDKLTSSLTLPSANVHKVAEDIALWEGSGGYHRHVIHYMLNKQLDKDARTTQEQKHNSTKQVSDQQKQKSSKFRGKEQLDSQGCTADDDMKSVRYEIKRNRNHQLITTPILPKQTFCIAYGFQQIQNIVRGLRKRLPAVRSYTFVQMMACPEGCLNGGGQIRSKERCSDSTTQTSFDEHQQFFRETKRVFAEYIMQQVKQSNETLVNKSKNTFTTQMMHNTKCKDVQTDINGKKAISTRASSDSSNDIANIWKNSNINQNWELRKSERHVRESNANTLILFSFAAMGKFAEWCGPASWLCKFTDRQKQFEQMLNEGNLHSLKW